jgi:hypothetical protein
MVWVFNFQFLILECQAIARAHRFGQKKPCLVFRLMGKQTAEGARVSLELYSQAHFFARAYDADWQEKARFGSPHRSIDGERSGEFG